MLGDLLAEQVVRLRGKLRVSGRRGSGSFGSDRTAGYVIGEDREHHPGWKPLQGSATIIVRSQRSCE